MNPIVEGIFRKGGANITQTGPKPSRPGGFVPIPTPVNPSGGGGIIRQILDRVDSGSIVRPRPIMPAGGVVRRWHLTPWKTTEATALLDDLNGSNLGEDEGDVGGWDVLNTLVGQAGDIYSASRGMVPYQPRPGQYLPAGSTISPFGTMSSNTLLILGAGLLGVFLLSRGKK